MEHCTTQRIKKEKNWHSDGSHGSSSALYDNDKENGRGMITGKESRQCLQLKAKYDLPKSPEEFVQVVQDILSDEAQKYDFFRVEFPSN